MTYKVQIVHVDYVTQFWDKVSPFIARALQYTDEYNLDQVKVFLTNGSWLLLIAVDESQAIHGVATVAFHNGTNARTAIITALGGKNVVNQDIFNQVCNISKNLGATKVQVYTRDSAMRLYERVGLKKKATLMEIKI